MQSEPRVSRKGLVTKLAFLAFFASLLSCGAKGTLVLYDGERKGRDKVAVIDLKSSRGLLTRIDSYDKGHFVIKKAHVEILPGQHSVVVVYNAIRAHRTLVSESPVTLDFEAQAGHVYIVKARAGYQRWTTWIQDITADTLVSDKKESFLAR